MARRHKIGAVVQAKDLNADYTLVTNSQDVRGILDNHVKRGKSLKYRTLFVLVGDGEYDEIFGCNQLVPLDLSLVWCIA